MPNTALNRTTQALLTNKSGGALNYGDVVVLDNTNANGFTTTTTAGLSTRGLGVILEPLGIANNASGMVAIGGWCPQVNLNTAAAAGQFIKTHTVAGQGTPHASPQAEGDFAVALSASATPACNLFGSPNGPVSGGAGTVTHTAGNLTANAVVIGNAVADITVLGSLGTTVTVLHGNAAGAPTFGAVALATDVSGDLPFANLAQLTALSIAANATNSTADLAATALSDGNTLKRVGTALTDTYFGPVSMSVLTSGTGATYTVPAGVYRLKVRVQGPGGGGGGGDQSGGGSGASGGGGGGGYAEQLYNTTPGATFTYTVGLKGAGGTAGNNNGSNGTAATVFDSGGSPITGNVGTGGGSMAAGTGLSAAAGGNGGTATGGLVNIPGQNGAQSVRWATNTQIQGPGGMSRLGNGGEFLSSTSAFATGYGGGGSGGSCFAGGTDVAGGDGSDGVIIVEEYK